MIDFAMSEGDLKNLVDSIDLESPINEERSDSARELEIEEAGQANMGKSVQVGGAKLRNYCIDQSEV